jgi:trafficking protein particle complex subunit 9
MVRYYSIIRNPCLISFSISTSGSIVVHYAFLNRSSESGQETVFYSRQLAFEIDITVQDALEVTDIDFLLFKSPVDKSKSRGHLRSSSVSSVIASSQVDSSLEECLREADEVNDCIAVVDVANHFTQAFDIILEKVNCTPRIRQRLTAKSTTRILIPIQRALISEKELELPIPSLSERQFVVSTQSPLHLRRDRELFWYREAALKQMRLLWRDVF